MQIMQAGVGVRIGSASLQISQCGLALWRLHKQQHSQHCSHLQADRCSTTSTIDDSRLRGPAYPAERVIIRRYVELQVC